MQTRLATPRAKNDSANVGGRSTDRLSVRSGVTPDSQALEKMNWGIRSIRLSSLAVSRPPSLKIQPEADGLSLS